MPIIVGGTRVRAVFDSVYNEVNTALAALGWFDSGRQHSDIVFRTEPYADKEEVPLNTLILVSGDSRVNQSVELGSDYSEHRRDFFLDFYAESQSLGEHVTFDIRDLLEGRMPSISRSEPEIDLYDYSQATPTFIRALEVEFVDVDRAHNFAFPWQKHWYSVSFTTVDCYGNEDD